MEGYRIAICDDESCDRERLRDLIRRNPLCPENLIINEYAAGEELLDHYEEFDAIFIDIGMGVMDGKETARAVREIDSTVLLAFYTGIEEYASHIVPVHPFIYLSKYDDEKVITKSLNLLLEEMVRRRCMPKLPVLGDGRLMLLKPANIVYITIRGKGSELWLTLDTIDRFHLKEKYVKSYLHLSAYYEQLHEYGFIYAHRSYIVNAEHVVMRNKNSVILENGCELNVARSKQKVFDKELSAFLGICYKRGERE